MMAPRTVLRSFAVLQYMSDLRPLDSSAGIGQAEAWPVMGAGRESILKSNLWRPRHQSAPPARGDDAANSQENHQGW